MSLTVDHVTISWSSLDTMERAFADAGLATNYGGAHGNGITHMDVLGFDDGSYVELISTLLPGPNPDASWAEAIAGDAGPCAWAVRAEDVAAEAERMRALGVTVVGPSAGGRERPDGQVLEWESVAPGEWGVGALLPFLIKDRTPRELRVRPSASVAGTELTGVAVVVLGVTDLVQAAALFRQVYGWQAATIQKDLDFGATLAHFVGTPVVLAENLSGDDLVYGPAPTDPASLPHGSAAREGWLTQRLERFGPLPCAFLLGTLDMSASLARLPLTRGRSWFGRDNAWFDSARLLGLRLGVIEGAV
jgi:hypothetical protein